MNPEIVTKAMADMKRIRESTAALDKGDEKVHVVWNTNGDTRVADHVPSITEFTEANVSHRKDVFRLMERVGFLLTRAARLHDWSKVEEPYQSMFYRDMADTIQGKMDFMDGDWATLHYNVLERHHLLKAVPDDVNLIDVIEMVCDCVAAGMARKGDIEEIDIPEDILKRAVWNTEKMLKELVVLDRPLKDTLKDAERRPGKNSD